MKVAIKEFPTYRGEILNNSLKLLDSVADLMHTSIPESYPLFNISETLSNLLNIN